MSKQYLAGHRLDQAHPTNIFCLAPTPTALISASGASSLLIHKTTEPTFPLQQRIPNAHPLGCHHVCTARGGPGKVAASVGFGCEVKVWRCKDDGEWELWWQLPEDKTARDVWAVALSADEAYLACSMSTGQVQVWDLTTRERVQTYETGNNINQQSFGMAVDLSRDGKLTASGHQNGSVYVFNNHSGRRAYSLSGLIQPIRAVAFSPGCKLLAAAGTAGIIAIYDMEHGEQVANLAAPGTNAAWITSLDWNETGEFLLCGSIDGKIRVWDVTRSVCVATHSETEDTLWSVRWLPKTPGMKGEWFCAAGVSKTITFYREATGT
ncbi:WD40-repeat-containing domain protein [Echria macrotheca]|uniref:WD40-repeat-containing domain protein n=1 Tax=Echria macrotheca TaxID=438768 RepID=A0AAJ0BAK6_9PEZI|nr:WD40-repeat-containing domain protein [Echria macrotheca]